MTKQICWICTVILIGASALLTGCSAQHKIEGTWTTSTTAFAGGQLSGSQTATYVFNHDNTMSITQHIGVGSFGMDIKEGGTYKVDSKNIDCSVANASISTSASKSPFGAALAAPRTVQMNMAVDYTWDLKDNNTLYVTVASVSGSSMAGRFYPIGQTYQLTRQS